MKQTLLIFLLLITAYSCTNKGQQNCPLKLTKPTCENLNNPIGIENKQPRLSWQLNAICNDQSQTAYQILVASSTEKLAQNKGDLWDSKKTKSAKTLNIPYQGSDLKTAQTYHWKVKVWNAQKSASEWSSPQQWTMGFITPNELQAKWIGLDIPIDSATTVQKEAAHYLYTQFETEANKTISNATAFVSGLGLFDFYINGNLASDHRLNPSNTNYFKRATYVGFDITNNINTGNNALGMILGHGKHLLQQRDRRQYGLPRLWCQIHLQYSDGSSQIIKSDEQWKISTQGPIRFNHEFHGERYDAQMEIDNWAKPNMNTSNWKTVNILEAYHPNLSPQLMPPVRVIETLTAKSITKIDQEKFILDFGQNIAGWAKLKVDEPSGTKIKLRFSERLDKLGHLDTLSIRGAKSTDIFIANGNGLQIFEPRFTYHGFRYIEITGLKNAPDTSTIKACVAHNDLQAVGTFVCSNPLLNQIYSNARWSIKNNYQHLPVDCPQRDERYAWLGDRSATAFGELYLHDIQSMYTKWMQDIADEQLENGALPNLAPGHWEVYKDNVTWPATYIQLVGLLYRYYGDQQVVSQHYDGMKKWMEYIAENYSADQVIYSDQYGDWMVPPKDINKKSNQDSRLKSAADILATTTYLLALKEMKTFAKLLQKTSDFNFYNKQISTYTNVLQNRLMDKSQHSYGNHSPTELLLLLADDDLSAANRSLLSSNLMGLLKGQYEGKMAFGLVGMRWPMQVLSKSGRLEFAYQLATNTAYPSWGYMVEQGATTMWEDWAGKRDKSQNHVMLIGDLLQWFYAYLGGIQQAEDGIAFDKLKLLPYLPADLDSVHVSFQSPRGKIISHWTKNNNHFHWNIELPVGCTAEVYLPFNPNEDAKTVDNFLRLDTLAGKNVYAVYAVGSGVHHFNCSLLKNTKEKNYSQPPSISTRDSIIVKKEGAKYLVTLSSTIPQTKIYYTLDGSDPNLKSTLYEKPFELQQHTMIKAIAKEKDKAPSYIKNTFVDIFDPKLNGWNYRYYEGKFKQIPNYDTLKAVATGRASIIDLKKLKKKRNFWAFKFEAYLEIPSDGDYTFYLESDDGSRLLIDNKAVVTNDGIHYKTQRKGTTFLTKGRHRITLEHFNWWSFNALELLISGPDIARQRLPVSWIFFED